MKISIVGTGYVGLVTGACLSEVGHKVLCLDVDSNKIERLKKGIMPIYETGLEEMVKRNVAEGRLSFTADLKESVNFGKVQMIAVGTPPGEDGSADLQYVLAAAKGIGQHMLEPKIIVNKSTVPVGTADLVQKAVLDQLRQRGLTLETEVVSNPEFLKEGAAIKDFMRPDRIVIGANSQSAIEIMKRIYAPFERNHDKVIVMDTRSSEFTKYAANAMLATRISFMNELARLAEKVDADIEFVRKGIGSDPRIGYDFLYPGVGYGGSCFPKDVKALLHLGKEKGLELEVLSAVERANKEQRSFFVNKIQKHFDHNLKGRKMAVWGLAFKPNTDDMREAPSLDIIKNLLSLGATVKVFDPVAMNEAKTVYGNQSGITFCNSPTETLEGADSLIVLTEWTAFKTLDYSLMSSLMKGRVIFDGRNIYNPIEVSENGFEYFGIGRKK
jgi:UDPglucose 6-dehydrogenase